jgi:hypothetical protein
MADKKDKTRVSALARGSASFVASFTSVSICFPFELIKTRMQIQGAQGSKEFGLASMKSIFKQEGI